MVPLTHALASYTLKRAAFPVVSRSVTLVIVIAGTIADLDFFSRYLGPSAYLSFDRTYFHSLLAALVIALLTALPFFFLKPKDSAIKIPVATVFATSLTAAVLHILLDLCQSSNIEFL